MFYSLLQNKVFRPLQNMDEYKKTCTICNSLFKLNGTEELLSKGGKYEIEDMTLESLKNESEI